MGELEDFVGCMIKHDHTNMTLIISQLVLINKITQGFNEDVKSLMTFNIPDKSHKGDVRNQLKDTKYHTIYRRDTGVV